MEKQKRSTLRVDHIYKGLFLGTLTFMASLGFGYLLTAPNLFGLAIGIAFVTILNALIGIWQLPKTKR